MRVDAARLYRAHGPALLRYLVRMTGEPETAEDILQDTFRRLLERPPSRRENLRGWLFTVATNRVRDLHRAGNRRRRGLALAQGRRTVGDPPPPPDRELEAARDRARVRAALDALPPRDRTVLLMREEGFPHREIAEAVGTTTGSVGTLVARALKRLAEALDETS